MRKLGVEEWVIRFVNVAYVPNLMFVNNEFSESFRVTVGTKERLVLSSLLFAIKMEAV